VQASAISFSFSSVSEKSVACSDMQPLPLKRSIQKPHSRNRVILPHFHNAANKSIREEGDEQYEAPCDNNQFSLVTLN